MDPIEQYMRLVEQRPELFVPSDRIPLCLEEAALREYAASSGKPVGVVYDNSPYYLVLADVCVGRENRMYTYARVVYPHSGSNGVVVIPRRGERFGLLSIFRHPPRMESGGEFPRGFAEDLSPAENAVKELREEIGVCARAEELVYLGDVRPDTGLSAGRVQVFLAHVEEAAVSPDNGEGIHGLRWVTERELRAQIADGSITDGLTLAAYARYICWSRLENGTGTGTLPGGGAGDISGDAPI